jgi:integrase
MRGQPSKRCTCRGPDGKQLGNQCPRLTERHHGAWYYRYSEPAGPDGHRRQPRIGPFPTKKDADTDRLARLTQLHQGLAPLTDRTLTIATDLPQWINTRFTIKPSTRRADTEINRLYITPGLGHLRLVDLRPHHLDDLYAAIRQIGPTLPEQPTPTLRRLLAARGTGPTSRRRITPARLRRIHAVLHAYLADRTRRRMTADNIAAHVRLPSGRAPQALVWTSQRTTRWTTTGRRPSPVMVWTPTHTGLFLDYAAEDRHYPLWHLIAFRGLRRGETCGLATTDLDLDAATLTIRVSRDDHATPDQHFEPETTKNRRSRTLALDTTTLTVLTTHLARQDDLRHQWGPLWHDSGLLFTTENGRPLVADTISQHFERLQARYEAIRRAPQAAIDTGREPPTPEALAIIHRLPLPAVKLALTGPPLPPIRLHDLRHVAACLAYRATKDLKLVSQLMGHSGIQITADIYTTLFEDVDRDAAEAIANTVPRTRPPH